MEKTRQLAVAIIAAASITFGALPSQASLLLANIYSGNVGMSIDAVGSNDAATGTLLAEVPTTATVLQAYLYGAGTPFPWYGNSPTSLADYNGSGITLDGAAVNNFDHLVGATSTPRPDIGQWFTGRADVTSVVNDYRTANPGLSSLSLAYTEGTLNDRIDGGVLVIVYEDAGLPTGSVVILDGGQDTGGETSSVNFAAPLVDPFAPGFIADMSLAISFSVGSSQKSNVDINGTRLTSAAGDDDDGAGQGDGSLITAGGVGDSNANPANPNDTNAADDELYDLRSFLNAGDMSFDIFTNNPSGDDNIFFLGLAISAEVTDVVTPGTRVPEPMTLALFGLGLTGLGMMRRRRAA